MKNFKFACLIWSLSSMASAEILSCRVDAVVSFVGRMNPSGSSATRVVNLTVKESSNRDQQVQGECEEVKGQLLQWQTAPADLQLGEDVIIDVALNSHSSGMHRFTINAVAAAYRSVTPRQQLKICVSADPVISNRIEIWVDGAAGTNPAMHYNLIAWEGGLQFERDLAGVDPGRFETALLKIRTLSDNRILMTAFRLGIWDDVLTCSP